MCECMYTLLPKVVRPERAVPKPPSPPPSSQTVDDYDIDGVDLGVEVDDVMSPGDVGKDSEVTDEMETDIKPIM